jgi:hypothetical protein
MGNAVVLPSFSMEAKYCSEELFPSSGAGDRTNMRGLTQANRETNREEDLRLRADLSLLEETWPHDIR